MARQFHHPHPSCAEWLSQSEVSFKCSPIRTSPHRRFSVFGYIISNMGLDLCSHNEPRRKRTCQTCKCVSTFPPVKHKHYLSPALPGEWGLFGCTRNTIPSPPPRLDTIAIDDLEPISQFANKLVLQLELDKTFNLLLTNSEKRAFR